MRGRAEEGLCSGHGPPGTLGRGPRNSQRQTPGLLAADPWDSRPQTPELPAADLGTLGHGHSRPRTPELLAAPAGPGLTYGEAADDLDQKHRQDAWLQQQAGDGLQIKHAGFGFPCGMRSGCQPTGQRLNAPGPAGPLLGAQPLPPQLLWLAAVLAVSLREGWAGGARGPRSRVLAAGARGLTPHTGCIPKGHTWGL